jgi:outer membrane protein OmpA-like peptidoglycan-associated protein
MGTFMSRYLDFSLGARRWSADIDRSNLGAFTPGTISDTSFDATLTYPLMHMKNLRPYVGGGLAVHSVGADIPSDRSLEDALSGVGFGALAVVGVGTTKPGLGFRLQARRDFVEDVEAWTYSLGAGWWPKSRAGKAPEIVPSKAPAPGVSGTGFKPSAAPTAAQPAAPQTRSYTSTEMVTALNHLKSENAALSAELATLKAQMAAMAAPASAATPGSAPAPVVEPAPDRGTQLFDALARVTALAGHPESLRREGAGGLLTLDQSLLFATGQSTLTTGAREELRRLAVVLLRFPESRVVVQGHTDSSGRAAANRRLSEQRAEAVRTELLSIGIHPGSVTAVGFGSTRPVAGNDTPDGRARNRRVDLLITMPSSSSN